MSISSFHLRSAYRLRVGRTFDLELKVNVSILSVKEGVPCPDNEMSQGSCLRCAGP